MTKNQILEHLKSKLEYMFGRNNPIPQEILDYINGTGDYNKIQTAQSYKVYNYYNYRLDKVFLDELDNENSEIAAKCLCVFIALSKDHIYLSIKDFEILKRLGFSFDDIIEMNKNQFGDFCSPEFVEKIVSLYSDEIEKNFTPEYFNSKQSKSKGYAKTLLTFIALYLIEKGVKTKQAFIDILFEIRNSTYTDFYIASRLYKIDPRFGERIVKLSQFPSNASEFIRRNLLGDEQLKQVMTDLNILDIYYANGLDMTTEKSIQKEAILKLSEDKEMLGKIMKHKDIPDNIAIPLSIMLSKGEGKDILPELEKHYSKMFAGGSNFFEIKDYEGDSAGSHFVNMVKLDPQKAVENTSMKWAGNGGDFCLYQALKNLSLLVDFSPLAESIFTALIKVCLKNASFDDWKLSLNITRLTEYCHSFVWRRFEVLGIPIYDSMKKLEGYFGKDPVMYTVLDYFNVSNLKFNSAHEDCIKYVAENMQYAEEFYDKIKANSPMTTALAELLFKYNNCQNIDMAISLINYKVKSVSKCIVEIISLNEEKYRPALEQAMKKFSKAGKSTAQNIIKKWDNVRKYGEDFDFKTNELVEEFVEDNYDSELEKKIKFIPESYFKDVRYADLSGTVSDKVIKYIFMEYLSLEEPYIISVCSKIVSKLYAPDFEICIENIYQDWLHNGADTKTKAITLPYCIFASDTQIMAMKKQLEKWAECNRGALGAYVVKNIAINGGSTALMLVNDIASKFKNKQIKNAAKEAFSFAAKTLGVAEEVLADKIVPDLGLDKNGEIIFDYGNRTFTVSLMPDFTFSIYDNAKEKIIKSMPKPGVNDDQAKAEMSKKSFTELKKKLKAVFNSQKSRLETVMRNGRTWNIDAWTKLFVENPVMHKFANTLIWGVYDDESNLISTFRYSDDGTFCDENDDEFELPENANISIIHPIEVSKEVLKAWNEQLADYEIVQPFPQLAYKIYTVNKDELNDKFIFKNYIGKEIYVSKITSAAKKYDLVRASVEDAGGYNGYHLRDEVLGLGMQIGAELFMGVNYDEQVELTNIYFYKLTGDHQPDSYKDYPALDPETLSKRFVSSCMEILQNILD